MSSTEEVLFCLSRHLLWWRQVARNGLWLMSVFLPQIYRVGSWPSSERHRLVGDGSVRTTFRAAELLFFPSLYSRTISINTRPPTSHNSSSYDLIPPPHRQTVPPPNFTTDKMGKDEFKEGMLSSSRLHWLRWRCARRYRTRAAPQYQLFQEFSFRCSRAYRSEPHASAEPPGAITNELARGLQERCQSLQDEMRTMPQPEGGRG